MKNLIFIVLLLCYNTLKAQSNKEIAGVYIKKAEENLNNLAIEKAGVNFNKAMQRLDTIETTSVAKLGTYITYELKNYKEAKKYAQQYFILSKKKKSEEYQNLLELYVDIEEKLEIILAKEKEEERIRLLNLKKQQEKDSLTTEWQTKLKSFIIEADTIYSFNTYNNAFFIKGDYIGILNDKGEVIIPANTYTKTLSNEGYTIFSNKASKPTQLLMYNHKTNKKQVIPEVSNFNPTATNYGKVMLPRANGKLVCYPDNSFKALIYDFNKNALAKNENSISILKSLKKSKIIKKFEEEEEKLKINKEWYFFGGNLGGAIHPLFNESPTCNGAIFSNAAEEKHLNNTITALGYFYNEKIEASINNNRTWLDKTGSKTEAPKNQDNNYKGTAKITLKNTKSYLIENSINNTNYIFYNNKKLETLSYFLKKYAIIKD